MKSNSSHSALLAVMSLCFLLSPIVTVIFVTLLYFFIKNQPFVSRALLIFIMLSVSFIAFLYERTGPTGDLYRYTQSFNYYYSSIEAGDRTNILQNYYEYFYPSWYLLFYIVSFFGLNIQIINFVAMGSILASVYYSVRLFTSDVGSSITKHLIIKMILFMPFVPLMSSYKTMFAFSVLFFGILMSLNARRSGYIFIFFAIGLHPICLIVTFIYIFSHVIRLSNHSFIIASILGLLLSPLTISIIPLFGIEFLTNKADTYLSGDWSAYRFHDNGEYAKVYVLVLFSIFLFLCIVFRKRWLSTHKFHELKWLSRYNQFIVLYTAVAFSLLSYRTLGMRLLLDGVVFFIPMFFQILSSRFLYKRNVASNFTLIIWLLIIDPRVINITNSSYVIGNSFPKNLLSSPISKVYNF